MLTSQLKTALLVIFFTPLILFGWDIQSYNSEILLRENGSINVTESITVNFYKEAHHGIYRMIPIVYKKGGTTFKIRVKNIIVTNERGRKIPLKVRNNGRYLNIRIGSSAKTVTGIQHYVIKYDVMRALMLNKEHVVLYWNIVGTEWFVPISNVNAFILFPKEVDSNDIIYKVSGGTYGKTNNDLTTDSLFKGELVIRSNRRLEPEEGMTLYMKLPKSIFSLPGKGREVIWFLEDNWIFLIPIFVFIFMFVLWYKNGRNPEFKDKSIMVRYNPPENLSAAEAGTLIDERCDAQDVNSILIDLARRGYIRIEEKESKKLLFMKNIDYDLVLLKDYKDDDLESYERKFLDAIFSSGTKSNVLLSSLKNSFYKDYKDIKEKIYKSLMKKGLFTSNPENVRNFYNAIGILIISLPIVFFMYFFAVSGANIYLFPVLILSGLIIMFFGRIMPKKTPKGVSKTLEIMGYKEYLTRVEKDELKERLKQNPNLFDEILPYALSLGIADVVATKFLQIVSQPPDWYVTSTTGIFTTTVFMSGLGNAMHSFNTAFTSTPSSSGGSAGGGFSGGGFGGGGGGAW